MDDLTFTNRADVAESMLQLRNGEGEQRGPQLAYAAILQVLKFATRKPSPYAMAREILTVGMLVPQEAKGAFINGLAGLYQEKEIDGEEWRKFRTKLQGLLLKQLALVQGAEMLLQDWKIDEPALKQMEMFLAPKGKPVIPDMTTGEIPKDEED